MCRVGTILVTPLHNVGLLASSVDVLCTAKNENSIVCLWLAGRTSELMQVQFGEDLIIPMAPYEHGNGGRFLLKEYWSIIDTYMAVETTGP